MDNGLTVSYTHINPTIDAINIFASLNVDTNY